MRRRKPDRVFKQKTSFLIYNKRVISACQLRNIAIAVYLAQFKTPCHYCEMRAAWALQRCVFLGASYMLRPLYKTNWSTSSVGSGLNRYKYGFTS
jgi:hypothetical protein